MLVLVHTISMTHDNFVVSARFYHALSSVPNEQRIELALLTKRVTVRIRPRRLVREKHLVYYQPRKRIGKPRFRQSLRAIHIVGQPRSVVPPTPVSMVAAKEEHIGSLLPAPLPVNKPTVPEQRALTPPVSEAKTGLGIHHVTPLQFLHQPLPSDASAQQTAQWLQAHRFGQHLRTFTSFSGADVLRLSRDDLIQICGLADGIRLYNALHAKAIAPRLTVYLCVEQSSVYHALFLSSLSCLEMANKLAQLMGVSCDQIRDIYVQGPGGIHVLITDEVVRNIKDESMYTIEILQELFVNHALASSATQSLARLSVWLNLTLTIPSKLDLLEFKFTNVPEQEDSFMFPEELNRSLREHIRILTDENGRLHRCLGERESELHIANEKLQCNEKRHIASSLSVLSNQGQTSELAASKIVELSKKVRELSSEIEIQKRKCRLAEAKLAEFCEAGLNSAEDKDIKPKQEDVEKDPNQVKLLTDKLQMTNQRLCDSRNQCQALKQDLRMVQKALCSEAGENVSIHSLSSNWRGRAQQIAALQQKLLELQEKLNEQTEKQVVGNADNRACVAMKVLEKERRIVQERTARELRERSVQLEDTKRRLDAGRARNKILEDELAGHKKRLSTLLDKGKHDDQLISMLTGQLSALEKRCSDREDEARRANSGWEEDKQHLLQDITREKSKLEKTETILAEKNVKIDQLEEKLRQTLLILSSNDKLQRSSSQDILFSSSWSLSKLSEHHQTHSMSTQEPCNEDYQLLFLSGEAERARLLELVGVLNRRLNQQRDDAETVQECLRKERQKAAKLETKLARVELERSGGSKVNSYRNKRASESDIVSREITYKMELLREEVLALKTRLQCVQQEKDEDLKVYVNLLSEARRSLLETNHNSDRSLFSREDSTRIKEQTLPSGGRKEQP
uniref:Uncharacterized protein n=1 Tax=Timema monikensis TaxID=170555 RepID=A0A7R9DZX4_9NEOP|nr:unnamed protein product [Timema monikensis]